MDDVELSPPFPSTSLAIPSPTGSHIAHLSASRLQVRCLATFNIIRSISLPASHDPRHSRIAWSPPPPPPCHASASRAPDPQSNRLLVTDESSTRVYDLRDEKWHALISNGSGGTGGVAHAEFGADEDEVLVWSEFCAAVKVWCLSSGRTVEVREPKFVGREGRGWGVRPGRGVVALLCRSAGVDVLMIMAAPSYAVLNRVELATTDAAGLKWSGDGRWLAVWDAASTGYKLCVYTADGHLYRTIVREPAEEAGEWAIEGLGIKSVDWLPGNAFLAIGGWDKRVRILSTRTFAPVLFLDHTPVIHIPSTPVYTELVDGQGNRSYSLTAQPTTPPKAALEKNETSVMKQGIGLVAFNATGTLCATRDDASPSTLWIWDLPSLKPSMICIQFAPVRTLAWHPTDPFTLLVQPNQDAPIVYLHTQIQTLLSTPSPDSPHRHQHTQHTQHTQPPPTILALSLPKPNTSSAPSSSTKYTALWLPTPPAKNLVFALSSPFAYMLVWPKGKGQILRFERGEAEAEAESTYRGGGGSEDEQRSEGEDSLFEILTGRKAGGDSERCERRESSERREGRETRETSRASESKIQRQRQRVGNTADIAPRDMGSGTQRRKLGETSRLESTRWVEAHLETEMEMEMEMEMGAEVERGVEHAGGGGYKQHRHNHNHNHDHTAETYTAYSAGLGESGLDEMF